MDTALRVVSEVVLAYFFAINLVYTALLVISVHESREHGRRLSFGGFDVILRSPLTLPVSVLMPAYNEESTIVQAVQALLLQEYGEFEIVVIDDGSTDDTLVRLIDAFDLKAVDRPRGSAFRASGWRPSTSPGGSRTSPSSPKRTAARPMH